MKPLKFIGSSEGDGVLHAFHKKTQQTRKEDIALAATRYKQLKESAK